jgi:polysaccharide export outer membrane protein
LDTRALLFVSSIFCLFVLFSCAPAKKQTYFQNTGPGTTYSEKVIEYRLQPGDVIQIKVYSLTPGEFDFFSELSDIELRTDPWLTGTLIGADGSVVLPAVGPIKIAGLTGREAQEKIRTVLQEYLDTPSVDVRLVSFDFSVVGEVQRQGKYQILDDRINILEAISMAGGLTEFANFETDKVLRSDNGISSLQKVNLLDNSLPNSAFYYIRPNDVIIVDQLKNKNFRRNSASNIALLLSAVATGITLVLAIDNLSGD